MRSDSFDGCSIVVQKSFIASATFGMRFPAGYDGSLLSCLETAARSGRNPLILFKHSCIEALRTANLMRPRKQFQSIRSSMLAGSWLTHGPLGSLPRMCLSQACCCFPNVTLSQGNDLGELPKRQKNGNAEWGSHPSLPLSFSLKPLAGIAAEAALAPSLARTRCRLLVRQPR